jgi:glycosyltransferase involved in cell wall biosynthesis
VPPQVQTTTHVACASTVLGGPLRVGYCIDSFDIGGTELNAVRTMEALDRQRFEVTVFHLHETGPLRARYEALGVRLLHLPIGRLYSPRTAAQGVSFLRLLRREGIEVVHTHDLYTNIFAAPWARLAGCRVIASRRWLDAVPRPGLVPLNRCSYRFAHRVVVNSSVVARLMIDTERVPAARVVELPNFVEERAFHHVSAGVRSARRRDWGIPQGAFLVGTVARLTPVKNQAMVLRALQRLDEDVHLALIGAGPSRRALEDLTRELNLDGRVHFTGQLVEAENLHQFFDVSVLSSRSEGFPNVVIEALAAGCPVVATPVGGVPEVISDRQTGLLVPVDQPEALAASLRELRRDAALRKRLSESGLAWARGKYHQTMVIARLEALYQDLAREAGKRSAVLT